jgi:hypothetical protein
MLNIGRQMPDRRHPLLSVLLFLLAVPTVFGQDDPGPLTFGAYLLSVVFHSS